MDSKILTDKIFARNIPFFVSDNISSHLLNDYETPANIEYVFVEIYIKEKVWLLH